MKRSAALIMLVVAFLVPPPCSGGETDAGRRVKIYADDAVFDREKGELFIPGEVTLTLDELKIKGSALVYDRDSGAARFENSPVLVEYEGKLRARLGAVSADLGARVVSAAGGCELEYEDEEMKVLMNAASVTVDVEKETAKASGRERVAVHYFSKLEPPAPEDDDFMPDVSEVHFSAGTVSYDFGAGRIAAAGAPVVEIENGRFAAPAFEVFLEDEIFKAAGIVMEMDDVTARAAGAVVYYGEGRAVLDGGVTAERGDEKMKAEKMEIGYRRGKRYVRLIGKGEFDLLHKPPAAGNERED
ncbi:MAG: hypothetical protein AB1742_02565 [bacterium]